MPGLYILDGKTPAPCEDVIVWGEWMNKNPHHVADEMIGDVRISTVFLGLDHSYWGGHLLFETMVFGGRLDLEQDRCSTWEEAEKMHELMCERVKLDGHKDKK